jgi:hypothetical protein
MKLEVGRSSVGLLLFMASSYGCTVAQGAPGGGASESERSLKDLVLLVREGCSGSAELRDNVGQALESLAPRPTLQVVDQGSLASDDPRTGYPTPTLLLDDADLFGLPVPRPPFPEPS